MTVLKAALPFALVLLTTSSCLAASFKDWEVGCDNTRACKAVGMASSDGDVSAYLLFTRGGSPDDAVKASFQVYTGNGDAAVKDKDFKLTVDGNPVSGFDEPVRFGGDPDGDFLQAKLSPPEIAALIQAFKNGADLKLTAPDGSVAADISLNGSMASLLYMDDKQHRIGTVTALARPGSQPANSIAAPPPEPEVAVVKAAANAKAPAGFLKAIWRQLRNGKNDSCVNGDDGDSASKEPDGDVDALDASHVLVTINCPGPGAYNQDSEFYLVTGSDTAKARPVSFPTVAEEDGKKPEPQTSLTNGSYDPKAGTLSYFDKGRGLGDCGDAGSYAWNGKAFALVSQSSMGACKGVSPDDWPVYWQAKTVPGK